MTVHKKLMAARVALQGIELKKSGQNKFAGYSYFELGDFLPHIQKIFNNIGLCGVVSYNTEYATLCITDVEDGTVIVITSPMAEANLKGTHPIQNLGAVETYQRRYLWMTAMEIVEHDILDASEPVREAPKKPEPKPEPEPEKPKFKQKPLPIPPPFKNDMVQWQIKVTESTEDNWIDIVMDAAKVCLELTKSADDVKNIYQVNRALFDKLKNEYPDQHDELLDLFKKENQSFKE
jgi:hypothetical protein